MITLLWSTIQYINTNAYFQKVQQLVLDEGQLPFLPVLILDAVGQDVQGRIDRLVPGGGLLQWRPLFREWRAAVAATQDDEYGGDGRGRERFHAGDRKEMEKTI